MSAAPISPASIASIGGDGEIERVNEVLSRPWTAHDRLRGRPVAQHLLDPGTVRRVLEAFRAAGWSVYFYSEPGQVDSYWFKPATP